MTTLAIYTSAAFTNSSGVAVAAGADVEVRRMDNGNLAVLWENEDGTGPLSNPALGLADSDGRFQFYVAGVDRGYSVAVTSGADTVTVDNQAIGTAAQLDQSAFLLKSEFLALGKMPVASAAGTVVFSDYYRENRLLNGDWLIDQINEGALHTSSSGANVLGPDGWTLRADGAGVFKVRTIVDPDDAAGKVLEVSCTTADASIAAGDRYMIFSAIEGNDVRDLKAGTASAESITIQFPSDFSVTGTYGIAIRNSAANRTYVGTFTQAAANAREPQRITLTLDTSGTWLYTTGIGLSVSICLAAGSTFQTTAGVWAAGDFSTTSAQANFMSSTSNIGYIGRIQLIQGAVALAYGPIDIQKALAKMQRYYEKSYSDGIVPGTVTGAPASTVITSVSSTPSTGWLTDRYRVTKRAASNVTIYSTTTGASAKVRNITGAADVTATVNSPGTSGHLVSFAGVANNEFNWQWVAECRLS